MYGYIHSYSLPNYGKCTFAKEKDKHEMLYNSVCII